MKLQNCEHCTQQKCQLPTSNWLKHEKQYCCLEMSLLGVMLIYVPEFSEPTVTRLPLLTQPAKHNCG